jgi:hypothetical protein
MAEYTGELLDAPLKPGRSAPPPAAAPAVQASDEFDKEFEQEKTRMKEKQTATAEELPKATPLLNEGLLLSPPALVSLGGAAGAAAMYGGSKAIPMVKRWLSSPEGAQQAAKQTSLNEEPWYSKNAGPQPWEKQAGSYWDWYNKQFPEAQAAPVATPAPSQNLTLEEAKARMAGVTPAPVAPSVAPAPVTAPAPVATSAAPVAAPVAPIEAPKPVVPSAAPNSPVTQAIAETVKDMVQAEAPKAVPVAPPTGELKTGSGLTAYPGQGKARERFPKEFKTAADIPAGYAFVPNMGAGTNVIRNDFGQAGYNALVQEQGGPFGADKETREFIKKYNEERMGPPATRELRKKLELPLPENTKGIPMKIAKVGGITGAIMAIPDLANAAQNQNIGQAAEVGAGFLPPAIQALTYAKGAGQGEEAELARQRRMQAYALQAGRGVAQGYDPRRLVGIAPP